MTPVAAGDLASVLPEILLTGAGVVLLLLGAFLPRLSARSLCLLACLAVIGCSGLLWSRPGPGASFQGVLEATPWTQAVGQLLLLTTLLALLASPTYLRRLDLRGGEYAALLLWATAGALFLVRATDLVPLFLALEILSLALYSLVGLPRRISLATESALKYFLMGAFVTAFVLFGIAMLYGRAGSTRLETIAQAALGGDLLALLGLLLVASGFAFKLALVPFHAWAPDTYQGAPGPVVAYLSVAPKVAAAFVLLRLLRFAPGLEAGAGWSDVVTVLSLGSMVLGNLLALAQRDIRRMLAYSGVAHMGYLLIPMVRLTPDSYPAIFVYLAAYALMNAGAFVVVALLFARANEQHLVGELSGWGHRFPLLGAALSLCLLSLAGLPPTAGFLGKYLVFLHAVRHGHHLLAVTGIVTTLLGMAYYARVVHVLYMKPVAVEPSELGIDLWGRLAALIAVLGTLLLGILPGRLLLWLRDLSASM